MKIIICTDYSPAGQVVLQEAQNFLKLIQDVEIHIYCVIDMAIVSASAVYNDTAPLNNLESEAAELKVLAEKIFEGKEIEFSSEVGYPVEKILNKVKSQAFELLIIGTHGRTGLNHIMMGSVAENVLRQINCKTLVIPVKHRKNG